MNRDGRWEGKEEGWEARTGKGDSVEEDKEKRERRVARVAGD